jgi:hypothetical protein
MGKLIGTIETVGKKTKFTTYCIVRDKKYFSRSIYLRDRPACIAYANMHKIEIIEEAANG